MNNINWQTKDQTVYIFVVVRESHSAIRLIKAGVEGVPHIGEAIAVGRGERRTF